MGLASALSTALTGLSASETTIDVVGNNLANSNTVGFKESRANFATQFLQTLSLGSAPTEDTGGTNPRQLGLGTMVADVTPNFNQGTIEISTNPLDMAIQGDGFFILQGASNEQLYSRNGVFKMNSQNELTNITGQRLLGYGVDDQFQIQATTLEPITIPLGAAAVAQATQHAYVEGTLSPTGDLGTQAAIIDSGQLGASEFVGPAHGADSWAAALNTTSVDTAVGQAVTAPQTTYRYVLSYFRTAGGAETQISNVVSGGPLTLTNAIGAGNGGTLRGIPSVQAPYDTVRIYRTLDGAPGTYYRVGEMTAAQVETTGGVFIDNMDDATAAGQPNPPAGSGTGPTVTDTSISGQEMAANGTYRYRVVFANTDTNTEGMPSDFREMTLLAGQDHAVLTGFPVDSTGVYDEVRVYRTLANDPNTYYRVAAFDMSLSGPAYSITDDMSDTELVTNDQTLDMSMLSATTYRYYFTFTDDSGLESRPQLMPNECLMNVAGRVELKGLPVPGAGDHPLPGTWTGLRIYRNTSRDQSQFYRLTSISSPTAGMVYVDSTADATLENADPPTPTLDFTGVTISYSTLLTNVVRWDGTTYQNPFQQGTFYFTPRKGGRALATKELAIGAQTTVGDLITFMEQSLGIVKSPGPDPNHPVPKSTVITGGTIDPGGSIVNKSIRLVGNNGTDNAVSIDTSGMQLLPTGQIANQTVNIPFTKFQDAVGETAVTDFIAYDSLGIALNVRLTAVLESRNSAQTTYRWFADSPENDPISGVNIAVGTGLISFDGEGSFISATQDRVSIDRRHVAAVSPESFQLDFSAISGLSAAHSTLAVSRQDGSAAGVLTSFIVGEDGTVRGVFSNGATRDLGQIRLARFANPAGLEQRGQNMFAAGINSGLPIQGNPGEQGIGSIIAGATELSNTDVGGNLIDLILASTMYRSNTRVITTVQEMLDELLALRR